MSWQRARQPEQIAHRRRQIMAAAQQAFVAGDYDKISLNRIARDAGLTKSNIYRYFETKEEIFLSLYLNDVREYVSDTGEQLAALGRHAEASDVADILSGGVVRRPRLAALTALLSMVLERTVSEAVLARFKQQISAVVEDLSQHLADALPDLDAAEIGKFVLFLQALVAGLWPMANPSPALERVLEREDFSHFRIHFARELKLAVEAVLLGLPQAQWHEGYQS